jgi:hypothetical protein
MWGWVDDLTQVLGAGIGSDIGGTIGTIANPIPGLDLITGVGGSVLGAYVGDRIAAGFDRAMSGSSNSGSSSSSSPAKTSPSTTSPSKTSPTLPKVLSEAQGLAADAKNEETTRLVNMTTILNDLDDDAKIQLSTVKAEAAAANKEVTDLTQAIKDEITAIGLTNNPQAQQALRDLLSAQHQQLKTIHDEQRTLSSAVTQATKNAAEKYDAVGKSSSGSSAPSSGGSATNPSTSTTNPSTSTTNPSTSTTNPSTSTTNPSTSTTNPSTSTTTSSNTYTPQELAAMESESPSGTSAEGLGGGGYAGSGISTLADILPMMMMPAMMAPEMAMSGLGGQRAEPGGMAPGGTLASNTTPTPPSDAGPNTPNGNASGSDGGGSGGGGKSQIVSSDTDTTPASSVQSVGNSVPVGPNNDVKLPDGTTTQAPNGQAATAARAALNGANPADAYQQAGVALPPPGTPVINPVAPGELQPGDIGVWKDHQVMALGDSKVLVDGQVQPESSIGSSPDFLGWMRPTQQSAAQPTAPAPVAATPASAPSAAVPVPIATGAPS